MNERKRLIKIAILEVLIAVEPNAVPESTLSARCSLRPPQPSIAEIKDSCEALERSKAIARDANPVTEEYRFSTTNSSASYLRALRS